MLRKAAGRLRSTEIPNKGTHEVYTRSTSSNLSVSIKSSTKGAFAAPKDENWNHAITEYYYTMELPVPTDGADPINQLDNPQDSIRQPGPPDEDCRPKDVSLPPGYRDSVVGEEPDDHRHDAIFPVSHYKDHPQPLEIAKDSPPARNVVFFGESGVGKSSVINMIRESGLSLSAPSEAPISSGAVGCTLSRQSFPVTWSSGEYLLWDTAGLNEGDRGSVNHEQATRDLLCLLQRGLSGGIHLLVYCIRGKRFRQVIKDNYDLFYRKVCRGGVPIVLVVTGLECEEPSMESWWEANREEFRHYGLQFNGYACITATRGKPLKGGGFQFDEEYMESRGKVENLIIAQSLSVGEGYQPPALDLHREQPARQLGQHRMRNQDLRRINTLWSLRQLILALSALRQQFTVPEEQHRRASSLDDNQLGRAPVQW